MVAILISVWFEERGVSFRVRISDVTRCWWHVGKTKLSTHETLSIESCYNSYGLNVANNRLQG